MGFLVQNSAADTAELRSQLALRESDIAQQHGEIATLKEQIELAGAEIEPMEPQIELVEATTGAFKATLTSLEEGREEVDGDLSQIVILTPAEVNLTAVNHMGDTVTAKGIAPDESDIFKYARDLRSSGRFPVVVISSITEYIKEIKEEEIKGFRFEFLLK